MEEKPERIDEVDILRVARRQRDVIIEMQRVFIKYGLSETTDVNFETGVITRDKPKTPDLRAVEPPKEAAG